MCVCVCVCASFFLLKTADLEYARAQPGCACFKMGDVELVTTVPPISCVSFRIADLY